MKKRIIILLFLISFILVGCQEKSTSKIFSSITSTPELSNSFEKQESKEIFEIAEVESELDISIFPELEPVSANLDSYRNEILKRVNDANNDQFLYDYESDVLKDCNYYVSPHSLWISLTEDSFAEVVMFYYPIIYRYKDNLVLWFTSDKGDLFFKTLYGNKNNIPSISVGSVHFDETSDDITIIKYESFVFSYNYDEGLITQWQFGNNVFQCNIPAESTYCGNSYGEGFLFRSGTDVYSYVYGEKTPKCIAHGVKFVLDSNYAFSTEAMYQPLFIMEDGQVLAYVGFESLGKEPDDPNHLLQPLKEGGHR